MKRIALERKERANDVCIVHSPARGSGESRFWRIDASADYGVLNGLARQTINQNLIIQNWDDILRVAGSLTLGTVNVTDLLRALQGNGHPSTLAKAIAELGRIAKTLYLLSYIDDPAYRRRILIQ